MMDENMSIFKRRLNKAVLECRSQASCTARRLLVQIRTMEKQSRIRKQQQVQAGSLHEPAASGHSKQRRQFSYSFAKPESNQKSSSSQIYATTDSAAVQQYYYCQTNGEESEQQQQVEEFFSDEDSTPQPSVSPSSSQQFQLQQAYNSNHQLLHRQIRSKNQEQDQNLFKLQSFIISDENDNYSEQQGKQIDDKAMKRNPLRVFGLRNLNSIKKLQASVKTSFKSSTRTSQAFGQQQHFVRYSAIGGSRRSSARRFRRSNQSGIHKQVRFQPIPHSASSCTSAATATCSVSEPHENEDDFSWGSDFDGQSSQDSSLTTNACTSEAAGGYLLEIGKSSADFQAVGDVIQDQGISGQFKRLESADFVDGASNYGASLSSRLLAEPQQQVRSSVASSAPASSATETKQPNVVAVQVDNSDHNSGDQSSTELGEKFLKSSEPEKQVVSGGGGGLVMLASQRTKQSSDDQDESPVEQQFEDEEDEEELRSLEARQGFRQIKDKLKLILDQRLANYEMSVRVSETGAISGQSAQKVNGDITTGKDAVESTVICSQSQHSELSIKHSNLEEVASGGVDEAASSSKVCTPQQVTSPSLTRDLIYEDCQSHCSDESGLESNHSGSQDSGHSTQHSGYSAHSRCVISVVSSSSNHSARPPTSTSIRPPLESPRDDLETPTSDKPHQPGGKIDEKVVPDNENDEEERELHERRSRFLQNRLIINSKLESLFQKGPSLPSSPEKKPPSSMSINGENTRESLSTAKSAGVAGIAQYRTERSPIKQQLGLNLDPATRMKLLEQQRQMSLKLKQKPRRKTAKQAYREQPNKDNNDDNQLNANHVNSNADDDNGSYVSNSSSSELQRVGSRRRATRDNLTKQLSMICLSQQQMRISISSAADNNNKSNAANQLMTSSPSSGSSGNLLMQHCKEQRATHLNASPVQHQQVNSALLTNRPAALSLRQLVKGVIDDYEKPTFGSSLDQTSDSSSSSCNLAISADDLPSSTGITKLRPVASCTTTTNNNNKNNKQQQQISQQEQPIRSIGQVRSQSSLAGSSKDSLSSLQSSTCSPTSCAPHLYQHQHQQPVHFVAPSQYHHQFSQQQQQVADQSMSSIGSTIDGLEYSHASAGLNNSDLATHQQITDQQNNSLNSSAAPNKCNNNSNRLSSNKPSIVSYLKSLREFSRFKLPKMRISNSSSNASTTANNQQLHLQDSHHQHLENNLTRYQQQQAPFDKSLLLNNINYACDYRLDTIGKHQQHSDTADKQPEGSINNNTLAGAWRRRAHRTSIVMESPVHSMASSSSVTSVKGDNTFANHFVTISNRKWKSCHLRTSLMQIAFNSSSSNNHQSSPIHGKQHLAYLDNSRNFTDDDTY